MRNKQLVIEHAYIGHDFCSMKRTETIYEDDFLIWFGHLPKQYKNYSNGYAALITVNAVDDGD